jgi:hypothetical protein
LLTCFDGRKTAGKARHHLDSQLGSRGDTLLDTVVLQVNAKHKASEHDPRQVVAGTVVPFVTWGLFGLLLGSSGWVSGLVWAVIGGVCGAIFSYYDLTRLSKGQWVRIGEHLPAESSSLMLFAETSDARHLLQSTASVQPAAASLAAISPDLTARVFAGANMPVELPSGSDAPKLASNQAAVLQMIMLRYGRPETAKQMAARMAPTKKGVDAPIEVELVGDTDADGHRRVTDVKFGTWAWAKSDLVSWGLLGVAVGFLAGLINGGLFGAVKGGIATGLIWAAFGLFAGTLYGLWAGRSITARRLKSIGTLLPPGTSMVVAWATRPIDSATLHAYTTDDSQQLVLRFNPVQGGAVLEVA